MPVGGPEDPSDNKLSLARSGARAPASQWANVSDQRRQNMSAIRGRDTKPELRVRRLLHSLGYRFTLHKAGLPGRPDIAFRSKSALKLVPSDEAQGSVQPILFL